MARGAAGKPAHPVERAVLKTGILDRLLTLRAQNGQRLLTPELNISYDPIDDAYAPHIDLNRKF